MDQPSLRNKTTQIGSNQTFVRPLQSREDLDLAKSNYSVERKEGTTPSSKFGDLGKISAMRVTNRYATLDEGGEVIDVKKSQAKTKA
jgi:hypothetical protein